jgi:hypothetical protein
VKRGKGERKEERRKKHTRVKSILEPDRYASDPLLLVTAHLPQALLKIPPRVLSKVVLTKDVSLSVHKVVRPSDDEELTVLEAPQARVERGVTTTGVKDPTVLLAVLSRLGGGSRAVALGRGGATGRESGVERRTEGLGRVGEGRGRHLVLLGGKDGGSRRVEGAGTEERVAGVDLEGSDGAGGEDGLLALIARDEVRVEGGRVRSGLVESADV